VILKERTFFDTHFMKFSAGMLSKATSASCMNSAIPHH
jgi:hypothetical protein